ncbi:hypothetical protein FQR65_LT14710 [Abscondita terminalis]|nr:hypothetical protein FQR65_LT14710 [Abscondita terminalis]
MRLSRYNAKQVKDILDKIPALIQGTPVLAQLGIGAVSGCLTGYVTMKVGKSAAVVAGGGIIAAQLAYSQGFGNVDWSKIQQKAKETQDKLNKTKLISNVNFL